MSALSESYTPQWLYLTEFMNALGGADEADKQEAVLLLIRDRLIFDGRIDEKHFRFLAGKPSIVDASWLADLSGDAVDWEQSSIRAPCGPENSPYQEAWFLIEIAVTGLSLFRSRTSPGTPAEPKRFKQPSAAMIRATIAEVYSEAKTKCERVPNIIETPKAVIEKLNARGYHASGNSIRTIAQEPPLKALRGPVGVRAT